MVIGVFDESVVKIVIIGVNWNRNAQPRAGAVEKPRLLGPGHHQIPEEHKQFLKLSYKNRKWSNAKQCYVIKNSRIYISL